MKHIGENVVRIEAEALRALADRIAGPMAAAFDRAVELIYACAGRVVVTGMGKSGIIARKIAATLSSTGTPALFMHPVDAVHGDLGMVVRGDVVLALSASGETEEILRLLATLKRLQVPLISMTGDPVFERAAEKAAGGSPATTQTHRQKLSTLAAAADVALDCSVAKEACGLGLAPTASTTAMLALGDGLAMALAEKRGFKEEDFANLHPGGKLGKRLAKVESLMHSGEAVPQRHATNKNAGCDLRNVAQEAGRDRCGRRREAGGRDQRWRFAAAAGKARQGCTGPDRGRVHDRQAQNHRGERIRGHGAGVDGRKENHVVGGSRWRATLF